MRRDTCCVAVGALCALACAPLHLWPSPGNRSGAARSGTLCLDVWGEVRRRDPRVLLGDSVCAPRQR